jgi:hypothetical protein
MAARRLLERNSIAVIRPVVFSLPTARGFEREGVKHPSRRIEGRYSDELYMSKLIAV